jgi:hypothetical protein
MLPSSRLMRPIALSLCAGLLLQTFPPSARADLSPVITVEVGQPSVWSLGQAHYLLAQMHKRDLGLSTQMPTEADLNPNRANAASLEAIRTMLGVEAQFDQGIGTQNKIALRNFQDTLSQRNGARVTLEERRAERLQASQELLDLNQRLAKLQVEDQIADKTRGDKTPPSAQDSDRKQQIAALTVERDAKKAQVDGLDAEITALTTTANTAPAAPTLSTSPVSSTAGSLPTSSTLTKFMDKFADEATTPSLSASTSLDNFVGMQYEIISKQLSLLRDEVGPDQRVIFLELPTSIYTVDKWSDNFIAKVGWKVTNYYDHKPTSATQLSVIARNLKSEGKKDCEIWDELYHIKGLSLRETEAFVTSSWSEETAQECKYLTGAEDSERERLSDFLNRMRLKREDSTANRYPVTLEMINTEHPEHLLSKETRADLETCTPATGRALEIIPQQSALNVNEYHATVNNWSFLGVLKLLVGFGAKVDYQRQKELYDKFMQQKIFASGFGKGSNCFGWIFGPLPGSKRIEPGQRTTYAVLAVPRNTLALDLTATSVIFKRRQSPEDGRVQKVQTFRVLVPGEATEQFWIDGVNYSSAAKGKRVTAFIEGKYFSPQLGIMVNGTPLNRIISVTRAGSEEPFPKPSGQGVEGEYEITNSREIVLSFSMGSDYIGTPVITFVTPERSTTINFFPTRVNYGHGRESLQAHSVREPMFIDSFNIEKDSEELKLKGIKGNFALRRLHGTGMRPRGRVFLNGREIDHKSEERELVRPCGSKLEDTIGESEFVCQESTQSYIAYIKDAPKDNWTIRYSQPTSQGLEEKDLKEQSAPAFVYKLLHYQSGKPAEADLTFTLPEKETFQDVVLESPPIPNASEAGGCKKTKDDEEGVIRVRCLVPRFKDEKTERDFIAVGINTVATTDKGEKKTLSHFADFALPVHPSIISIKNLLTKKPSGSANVDATVVIEGANFQGVTAVLFGDKEAQILTPSDPTSLMVKVPKVEIPRGEASAVPVILRSASGSVSAGTYTYWGERMPRVVAYPYPYPWPPKPE